MSKSIYINDMRRDIDEGGGGGGATSADQVSYNGGTVKGALDTVRGDLNTFQFRMNEGSGEYKLESEGADSWRPFKSGATMELLWENPNPTSAFSAQTIIVDLSNYRYIIIKAAFNSSNHLDKISQFFYDKENLPTTEQNFAMQFVILSSGGEVFRKINSISDSGVIFGSGGYGSDTTNNLNGIPLAIYGIR